MIFTSFKTLHLIFMKLSVLHLGVRISNFSCFTNLHLNLRGPLRPNSLIIFPPLNIIKGTIFRYYYINEKFISYLQIVDLGGL